jgi:NAD(P)-dependent dehydrogenase (short-subunit alcohol dehydrogenase family)
VNAASALPAPVVEWNQPNSLHFCHFHWRVSQEVSVASAVVFLASSEASYLTGATLHVNGGMAML